MRYKVFNTKDGVVPVLSAPWRWPVEVLASFRSDNWAWYRLVDSKTGKTIVEWARGATVPNDQQTK